MIVAREIERLEPATARCVAIGAFDGIHLGHRAVIGEVVISGLRSTVITFDPHPRKVLGRRVEVISSLARRLELIADQNPDEVLVQEFTPALASLEPHAWVEKVLLPLAVRRIIVGETFRFGRRRAGDVALLREMGFEVCPMPVVRGISSSRIRRLVRGGRIEDAGGMLGRLPEIEGTMVHPRTEHVLTEGWPCIPLKALESMGSQVAVEAEYPDALIAVGRDQLLPATGLYEGSLGDSSVLISVDDRPGLGGRRRVELWNAELEAEAMATPVRVQLMRRVNGYRTAPHEQFLLDSAGPAAMLTK